MHSSEIKQLKEADQKFGSSIIQSLIYREEREGGGQRRERERLCKREGEWEERKRCVRT